jgi:hypothetical protein
MNAEECHRRAAACALNASRAQNERLAHEFLTVAAQWRAMAVRDIFLGYISERSDPLGAAGWAESNAAADRH